MRRSGFRLEEDLARCRCNSQFDRIVRGVEQILFRAKIAFRRLDRGVSQEQLDLLKLPAAGSTQLGAGSAEVMGRDPRNTGSLRVRFDELPDDFLAQAVTTNSVRAVNGPENMLLRYTCRRSPSIDCHLHPIRHRHRTDPAVLAHK